MKNLKVLSKRGLSLLIAGVMCASMMPMQAFATYNNPKDDPQNYVYVYVNIDKDKIRDTEVNPPEFSSTVKTSEESDETTNLKTVMEAAKEAAEKSGENSELVFDGDNTLETSVKDAMQTVTENKGALVKAETNLPATPDEGSEGSEGSDTTQSPAIAEEASEFIKDTNSEFLTITPLPRSKLGN